MESPHACAYMILRMCTYVHTSIHINIHNICKHKFVAITFHSLCTHFTDDDMLQESGILTGQLMILEVKKADGRWPRDTSKSWS